MAVNAILEQLQSEQAGVQERIAARMAEQSGMQQALSLEFPVFFPNGVRLNSALQQRRFIRFLAEHYGSEGTGEDAIEAARSVLVESDDGIFMTGEQLLGSDTALLADMLSHILELFGSGHNQWNLEHIWTTFQDRLRKTNIFSVETLSRLLSPYLLPEIITYGNRLVLANQRTASANKLVLECLANYQEPVDRETLHEQLPVLTSTQISNALTLDSRAISMGQNTYLHISNFPINEQALVEMINLLKQELRNGFLSFNKFYEIMESSRPHFLKKHRIENPTCLRDIIKYYTWDDPEIKISYHYVGGVHEDMSSRAAAARFYSHKNEFALDEFLGYLQENGLPQSPNIYVDDLVQHFIRLNSQTFIRATHYTLESDMVRRIEESTVKYLTRGYAPVSAIEDFTLFPVIDQQWNAFLLESIAQHLCPSLRVFYIVRSFERPMGILVAASAHYQNVEEVLEDAILHRHRQTPFLQKEELLDFLVEQRFLAIRRYNGVNKIFFKLRNG